MSVFEREQIMSAGESGHPALLACAADITGSTPEQVMQAARFGMMPVESLVIDPSDPADAAEQIVLASWSCDGVRELHYQGGVPYEYRRGCYKLADVDALRAGVHGVLRSARELDGKANNGEAKYEPVKVTTRLVNETIDAIRSICNLHTRHAAPCWLEHDADHPAAHETLSTSNGLLHLPTRTLYPPTPLFYTHTAAPFAWKPNADEPVNWFKFLGEVFQDDPDAIDALQEWCGLMLLPDTRHQKILLIVGPKRSGKGTIARTLTALLGQDNVCAPTLASLSSPFGLSPLIGKLAAVISDARLSARQDQATIAERLLSISGEDTVTVDRKFSQAWTGRLSTRFIVMTNELPRLADASGALASRFIVLNMVKSFYGREDLGLFDRLRGELPGIFGWALEGYDRLRRRGYLLQPDSAKEAIAELEDLGSPVGAFIRDRCTVGPGYSAVCSDIYDAWKGWCEQEGRDHPGTKPSFGRDLRAAVPGLCGGQRRTSFGVVRIYKGIGLD